MDNVFTAWFMREDWAVLRWVILGVTAANLLYLRLLVRSIRDLTKEVKEIATWMSSINTWKDLHDDANKERFEHNEADIRELRRRAYS